MTALHQFLDAVLIMDKDPQDVSNVGRLNQLHPPIDATTGRTMGPGATQSIALLSPQPSDYQIRGLQAVKPSIKAIAVKMLLRWLITVCFALSITGVLIYYSRVPVLSRSMKREFNAVITGLSIGLGLAMVSCLDEMVKDLRWWVLSRRYRSRRKV